jgi:hypothetical protein
MTSLVAAAIIQLVTGCARGATGVPADDAGVPGVDTADAGSQAGRATCTSRGAGWIWCDDFEQDRLGQYFEYESDDGRFTRARGAGRGGSTGMRAHFSQGTVSAGNLKVAFGRTPDRYFRPVDGGTARYRDIYWRVWTRNQPGFRSGVDSKMSRAIVFAGGNWSEAAIGHVWSAGPSGAHLMLDPASGTDVAGTVRTTKYNDFPRLRWLGSTLGRTPLLGTEQAGTWRCVEAHMRLNDPGQSNGVFELWVDGSLDASRANLNWVGSYAPYGINAVFLENYWNDGSPVAQERYFDDFVVSTRRIGC